MGQVDVGALAAHIREYLEGQQEQLPAGHQLQQLPKADKRSQRHPQDASGGIFWLGCVGLGQGLG